MVPSFHTVVYPSDLGFEQVVPYIIDRLKGVSG